MAATPKSQPANGNEHDFSPSVPIDPVAGKSNGLDAVVLGKFFAGVSFGTAGEVAEI